MEEVEDDVEADEGDAELEALEAAALKAFLEGAEEPQEQAAAAGAAAPEEDTEDVAVEPVDLLDDEPEASAGRALTPAPPKQPPPGKGRGKASGKAVVPGKTGFAGGKGPSKGPSSAPVTANAVTAKIVALSRSGIWGKGSGIDARGSTTLRSLPPERAMEILEELQAKGAVVKNPSAFIQLAARRPQAAAKPGAVPAKPPGAVVPKSALAKPSAAPSVPKRPGPVPEAGSQPPAKRLAVPAVSSTAKTAPAAAPAAAPAKAEPAKAGGAVRVSVSAKVAAKIKLLQEQGVKLAASAIKELAAVEVQEALVLLQALVSGNNKAEDPSKWIIASIRQRKAKAGATPPAAPAGGQITKAPAKAAVAKQAVAKVAFAKVAKAPAKGPAIAKAPGRPGQGKAPQVRTDLDFDESVMQAKVQHLNKLGVWPGPHPLDEAALDALIKLKDPQRAMEILDAMEEQGDAIADPAEHVQREVDAELKTR